MFKNSLSPFCILAITLLSSVVAQDDLSKCSAVKPCYQGCCSKEGYNERRPENVKVEITDDWYPGIVVSVESPRNGEVTEGSD